MWVTIPATSTTVDLEPYGVSSTESECISIIGMFDAYGKRINLSADSEPLVGELILTSPIFEGTRGKIGKDSMYSLPLLFQVIGIISSVQMRHMRFLVSQLQHLQKSVEKVRLTVIIRKKLLAITMVCSHQL